VGRLRGGQFVERTTFKRGSRIAVLARLAQNEEPVEGVMVLLAIQAPNGQSIPLRAVSDGQGLAKARYRIPKRAPAGTYEVKVVEVIGPNVTLNSTSSKMRASFVVR